MSTISRHATHAARKSKDAVVRDFIGEGELTYHDLTVQFIGASGIPKMDVVGSADPYFIADLDGHVSIVCVILFYFYFSSMLWLPSAPSTLLPSSAVVADRGRPIPVHSVIPDP